jgi:hypothetical protein
VAVRAPLLAHVTVLLLIAVAVAVAMGASMWLIFDRHLQNHTPAAPSDHLRCSMQRRCQA